MYRTVRSNNIKVREDGRTHMGGNGDLICSEVPE